MNKVFLTKLIASIAFGLCLSLPVQADNPDSINRIAASNFGFDQAEIDSIRSRMQEAVDGEFIPGALLLVGDPKQSIYRFRRADVVLYQEMKERLSQAGVGVRNLDLVIGHLGHGPLLTHGVEQQARLFVLGQPGLDRDSLVFRDRAVHIPGQQGFQVARTLESGVLSHWIPSRPASDSSISRRRFLAWNIRVLTVFSGTSTISAISLTDNS